MVNGFRVPGLTVVSSCYVSFGLAHLQDEWIGNADGA